MLSARCDFDKTLVLFIAFKYDETASALFSSALNTLHVKQNIEGEDIEDVVLCEKYRREQSSKTQM